MPVDQARATVAIVGATGAVGREALAVLAGRGHPADRVIPLASARSAGEVIEYGSESVKVRELPAIGFPACDVAIFCATAGIAQDAGPRAVASGALVIDNSSAFRMDPSVPLVVPEINADSIGQARLIANPNCSTIILLTALNPIRKKFGVSRVVVSTYQAVSGAGIEAVRELESQTRDVLDGKPALPKVLPQACAFNVFSHESTIDEATGFNGEEAKMIAESGRIWAGEPFELIPTCVRVPVMRAHTQSAMVTLASPATEAELLETLEGAPGVTVVEDRASNRFPTPLQATGGEGVLAGRIRCFSPTECGVLIAGDQLRKGAALNAIQIMDHVLTGTSARIPG
ncbi:MAG: aspartate-semialdehyde dehydrogenase [Phycisphaerales bacterium]